MPGRPGLHPVWQSQKLGGGSKVSFCPVHVYMCTCVCSCVCMCVSGTAAGEVQHLLCLGSVVRVLSSGWQAAQDSKPVLCRQKCQMVRIGGVPGLAAKGEEASVLWRAGL